MPPSLQLTFEQRVGLAVRKVADAGTALRRLDPNQLTRVGALQREDAVTVVVYWTVVKGGLISHLAHSSPSSPHLQWLRDECTPSYLVRRLATCSPTLHTVDASDKKRFRTAVINATTRARKRTPNAPLSTAKISLSPILP